MDVQLKQNPVESVAYCHQQMALETHVKIGNHHSVSPQPWRSCSQLLPRLDLYGSISNFPVWAHLGSISWPYLLDDGPIYPIPTIILNATWLILCRNESLSSLSLDGLLRRFDQSVSPWLSVMIWIINTQNLIPKVTSEACWSDSVILLRHVCHVTCAKHLNHFQRFQIDIYWIVKKINLTR